MVTMAAKNNCDVFIIEDDCDIREALTEVLEDKGYGVAAACNGKEAVQTLSIMRGKPKLILLDLRMPVMGGRQFVCEQKKNPKLSEVPVVVVSADANLRQKADSMGASGHLPKPVEFDALLDTVKRYCG